MMARGLGAAFVLGAGLASFPVIAADPPASSKDGGLHRIPLPEVEGQGERPLEWILRRVASKEDGWIGETIHEEVSARLHELDGLLIDRARLDEGLRGLLSEGFRGSLKAIEREVLSSPFARAWRGAPDPAAVEVGPEDLAVEIQRFLAPLARAEKAKFKVHRVEPGEGSPRTARTLALLEIDGPGTAARHAQLRAELVVDWREAEGAFRIARLRLVESERVEMPRRPFTDITGRALGAVESFRSQLRFGLEHWRTRLDAASEIEIYGHQGIACADVDGDGREDLYVAQPAGLPNRLYRATGEGGFEDITAAAGLGILDETGAVLFLDLENDGDPDLLAVTPLELLLFENDGKGRFRRRESTGLEAAGARRASMVGAAAADYDLDGDLDLYIVSYVFWAGASSKAASAYPFPYHDANNGAPNLLFRNDGAFRFTDVTVPSGMDVRNRRFSLAAAWSDFDEDGDPDLYVANDFGKNNLYRNEGGGRFSEVAEELGVEDTGNGMSVDWGDFDGDGREDLYVGNMWSSAGSRLSAHPGFRRAVPSAPGVAGAEDPSAVPHAPAEVYARMAKGNTLFRNLGGGRFEDVTSRTRTAFGRWAWSSQFLDADGDGWQDLYVLNGFVTGEKTDDL